MLQPRLEQKLRLAPQIIQSIEVLQLPILGLQDLIREEMLENPTLELEDERPLDDLSTPERDAEPRAEPTDELPSAFERLEEMGAEIPELNNWRSQGDASDRKQEAMNNTPAPQQSLHAYLLGQFRLLPNVTDREILIAQHLIYGIDQQTGWLGTSSAGEFQAASLTDLVATAEPPCSLQEAEAVLAHIQALDPPGVGARGLQECLLQQLSADDVLARSLIIDHFDELLKNKLPKLARATRSNIDDIKDAISLIATLSPYPGALFNTPPPRYIVPDLEVEYVDGDYEVRLLDAYVPRLQISPRYREMLKTQIDNPAVREYLKRKVEAARWLIDSIEQRQHTLKRIAVATMKHHRGFLDKGVDALKPLKMQEIADEVQTHVSTVSRAIADKYIQTPRGVLPLRYFFTGGTVNADGEEESVLALKQKARDVVAKEDKRKPLSDEDIATELRAMGYEVARRTVTKYRKQLGIPSSRQRREY